MNYSTSRTDILATANVVHMARALSVMLFGGRLVHHKRKFGIIQGNLSVPAARLEGVSSTKRDTGSFSSRVVIPSVVEASWTELIPSFFWVSHVCMRATDQHCRDLLVVPFSYTHRPANQKSSPLIPPIKLNPHSQSLFRNNQIFDLVGPPERRQSRLSSFLAHNFFFQANKLRVNLTATGRDQHSPIIIIIIIIIIIRQ